MPVPATSHSSFCFSLVHIVIIPRRVVIVSFQTNTFSHRKSHYITSEIIFHQYIAHMFASQAVKTGWYFNKQYQPVIQRYFSASNASAFWVL